MKKSYIILGVIAVIAIALFVSGKSTYNSFVGLDQTVEQSWAQVENQYQRRLDLIPNLVEAVKGYAKHESETYESVTRARAGLSDAYNSAGEASGEIKTVASPSQEQLDGYMAAQQSLQRALSIYVNAVREYNVRVKSFPANIWAGIFGYGAKAQFKADPEAAHAPKVQF
jgi:LemA protein